MPRKTSRSKKSPPRTGGDKSDGLRAGAGAVILFAAAILTVFLLLRPGENLWLLLHSLLHGVWGWCGLAVPPVMVWLSVTLARAESRAKFTAKLWQLTLLLLLLCSTVHIFAAPSAKTMNYPAALADAWSRDSGGIFGALLGYPMQYLFTDTGARIIIALVLFVCVMLITGTPLLTLLRTLKKPVDKTRAAVVSVREKSKKPIHVDMGDGYPGGTPPPPWEGAAPDSDVSPGFADGVPGDAPAFPQVADVSAEPVDTGRILEVVQAAQAQDQGLGNAVPLFTSAPEYAPPVPEPHAYRLPPLSLLDKPQPTPQGAREQEQQQTAELLVKTLGDFGVNTRVVHISHGPSVTRYELEPHAGVKISRITGLTDDIALRLATTGVRIEAPIPNKAAVGIEVPGRIRATVCLRELLDNPQFTAAPGKLTVALGKDITGETVLADLARMPHLLIAGTTGAGKSVCTNSMIQSMLFRATPEEVRMILIDPKQVEFGMYNGIPHLLVPVVTDPRKAAGALGWAVTEMLRRYKLFAENNVRDLASYNELVRAGGANEEELGEEARPLPLILIVIDELSDLMMTAANEVEDAIIRLAQMARAAGMHMVIATQRPSVDVITGLIKANIPSRLALAVASAVDSRTILDGGGAERLLGKGDMLFMPLGISKPMRVQGCFVSDQEIERVIRFLKAEGEAGGYDEDAIQSIDEKAASIGVKGKGKAAGEGGEDDLLEGADPLLTQAVEFILTTGAASVSALQRELSVGHARAGKLIDQMEKRGILGPYAGSKPREILINRQQWFEMQL